MTPFIAVSNLMLLAAGILFLVTPEMSRPGTFFGVTVVPEFARTEEGNALLKRYRQRIAVLTLAVIVLITVGASIARGLIVPIGIGLEGAAAIACWVRASKEARAFAQAVPSIRTASLSSDSRTLPGGWLFLLGPYVILALAGWFLYSNWHAIPERFPIHWGADGTPNGWSNRTVPGVFGILVVGLFSNILTTVFAYVVVMRTRNASASEGDASGDRAFKRATYFLMMFISYLMSLVFAVVSTRPVWAGSSQASPLPILLVPFVFAVLIAVVVYLVRLSRSRKGSTGDGTPDACWRWGMFYYNPDDPSLLVEKRMGLGWTLNFANKWSWVLLGVTVLPTLVILVAVRLMTN